MQVHDLGIKVKALLLSKSPPVLSLGRLCRQNGFRYIWEPYGAIPILEKGNIRVQCLPRNDVPFITSAKTLEFKMNVEETPNAGGGPCSEEKEQMANEESPKPEETKTAEGDLSEGIDLTDIRARWSRKDLKSEIFQL